MSLIHIDMVQVIKLARDLGLAAQMMPMATEAALEQAGIHTQAEAKDAAPVLTGALRDSIYLKAGKSTRTIGSNVYYGVYQEFGTVKMAPHPWLYAAGEHGQEELARSVLLAADPLP